MRKNKFVLGLFIAALMLVGVTSLFLIDTSAQQMRIIALTQGWNLVTWTGEKQSAAEALDSVSDAVSAVYGYDNDSQTFSRYFIDRPEISTLTDFEPEEAYWVLVHRYSATWWVPGLACPDCGSWQSAAEQCLAEYGEAADALTECVALLAMCNTEPPDSPDTTTVCNLIDDLRFQYDLAVPILDQYSLPWLSLTFVVQDLEGWAIWNCP